MDKETELIQGIKSRVNSLSKDSTPDDCYKLRGLLADLAIIKKGKG